MSFFPAIVAIHYIYVRWPFEGLSGILPSKYQDTRTKITKKTHLPPPVPLSKTECLFNVVSP